MGPVMQRWLTLSHLVFVTSFLIASPTTVCLPDLRFKDDRTRYSFDAGRTEEINFFLTKRVTEGQTIDVIVQHEQGNVFNRQCLLKQSYYKCTSEYKLCLCLHEVRGNFLLRKTFAVKDGGQWSFYVRSDGNHTDPVSIQITVTDNSTKVAIISVVVCLLVIIISSVLGMLFIIRRYPQRCQRIREFYTVLQRICRGPVLPGDGAAGRTSGKRRDNLRSVSESVEYTSPSVRSLVKDFNKKAESSEEHTYVECSDDTYHYYGQLSVAERRIPFEAVHQQPDDSQKPPAKHSVEVHEDHGLYLTPLTARKLTNVSKSTDGAADNAF